jgi:hypothetical protein
VHSDPGYSKYSHPETSLYRCKVEEDDPKGDNKTGESNGKNGPEEDELMEDQ